MLALTMESLLALSKNIPQEVKIPLRISTTRHWVLEVMMIFTGAKKEMIYVGMVTMRIAILNILQ